MWRLRAWKYLEGIVIHNSNRQAPRSTRHPTRKIQTARYSKLGKAWKSIYGNVAAVYIYSSPIF